MGHLLIGYFASDAAQSRALRRYVAARGAAGRDPANEHPLWTNPNFADRMKRMRETAQLLQKTETPENAVSYGELDVGLVDLYLGRWVKSC